MVRGMRRQWQSLLVHNKGGGGGGGGGVTPRTLGTPGSFGYTTSEGAEVGDIIIFGYNYRGSGTSSAGQPSLSGTATYGSVSTLYANSRYDTGGVSDGGISMHWATITGAGDVTVGTSGDRLTYHMVVPGYNTVVQNSIGGGDTDSTPETTLASEPTGPVLGFSLGGGGTDTSPFTAVSDGFVEHQPAFHAASGSQKFTGSWVGTAQTFGYTATATQVLNGGAFAVAVELGIASFNILQESTDNLLQESTDQLLLEN